MWEPSTRLFAATICSMPDWEMAAYPPLNRNRESSGLIEMGDMPGYDISLQPSAMRNWVKPAIGILLFGGCCHDASTHCQMSGSVGDTNTCGGVRQAVKTPQIAWWKAMGAVELAMTRHYLHHQWDVTENWSWTLSHNAELAETK